MKIGHEQLKRLVGSICAAAGTPQIHASQVAELLVEANLQGHDSHGVGMLPIYIRNIKKGFLIPEAEVKTIIETGNLLQLDGQFGFGQVVGPQAMDLAIAATKQQGLCVMTLKNAHHLGRIGALGEQAARAGLISLHFVNVVGHNPLVAPFGGATARMNTNPFCCAIPIGNDLPLILDMATSTIALGKARVAYNSGTTVAHGCLVDHEGVPTVDPSVMFTKPAGALTYIGEHKGFGLALVCELLAGALVGQWTAQDEHPRPLNVVNHMLTVLLDPGVFDSSNGFQMEARKLISYIKSTPPAQGIDSVMIPGEPERRMRMKCLANGIEIDPTSWEQLLETARSVGLNEVEY